MTGLHLGLTLWYNRRKHHVALTLAHIVYSLSRHVLTAGLVALLGCYL